ncbi:cyclin-dependent kinase inhibitor 3 family protein [Rhodovulum euryhalinum]|uniref:Cyclin-dependent kinase inhibitor 3 (CDKN3) n=1 Tax=Rhodovulum euryhalinum TaxID=35805 RepID=A0A4R2KDU0_9RHOB|nr:cyclin-dependent kinase inhibitor 3 family protein [Rhodovulum euryhalinum]TCO71124.1 cyclin-dependent kinase inhibitor 3 (CDKN3) [Rhodovulum euryhalinum]
MARSRTSLTHPLQIAEVRAGPGLGRIGITFCPGKQDPAAATGAWARDLATDLDAIAAWGARLVLTLVEPAELVALKVPDLGAESVARGLDWRHLPIADYSVPTPAFEAAWQADGRDIRAILRGGGDVLVHCKGGLGRAGMIAARLLAELGMAPDAAIRAVRRARPGAIETPSQLAAVRRTLALADEGPLDIADLERIGGRLGSTPGGLYRDSAGRRIYVKELESAAHALNERIAARLYRLAGAPTLNYLPMTDPALVATAFVDLDKRHIAGFSPGERRQAQGWLGVHAWTANWDAAGFDGDNQGVAGGVVLTLDMGGALEYRASGDPKGRAFGTTVDELDRLRTDPDNPHAARLFGDMDDAAVTVAIRVVTRLPDDAIRRAVAGMGGRPVLADRMIARKADMARRLG